MSIDPLHEKLLTLTAACKLFPKTARGKKIHVSTLYRYSIKGLRGVVLATIQCGSTRSTSEQAVARFFHTLTLKSSVPQTNNSGGYPMSKRSDKEVEDELDDVGLN